MTYAFRKKISIQTVGPNHIKRHLAHLSVNKGRYKRLFSQTIPCRSSLYYLVNSCYFNGSRGQNEAYRSITEEDLGILKRIFAFRQNYPIWRKGKKILGEKGVEEAMNYLREKAQLYGMIMEMK